MAPLDVQSAEKASFGPFELDTRTAELFRSGQKVRLSGQSAHLLVILVKRSNKLVSREDLRLALWPEDTYGEFDSGLNNCISRIREALGDSVALPRYIETLPKQGYRFIAEVCVSGLAMGDSVQSPRSEETLGRNGHPFIGMSIGASDTVRKQSPAPPHRTAVIRAVLAAAIFIIALPLLLLLLNVRGWRDRLFVRSTQIRALAVLPFENLSNAPEQEYFSDGMTEAVISELGRFSAPRVISRQSIMRFKGSKKPLQEIARELKVDAVVEGTVERSGDRVRISVRLVETDPERQLWAQEYNRDILDVLALHADIARSVSNEIRAKLNPDQQRNLTSRQPVDAEAHSEYLKGLYFEHIDTAVAITHFNNSIRLDRTFAPAFAELAMSYFWQAHQYAAGPPVPEMQPLARAAATKALQLDPALAPAHLALGLLATSDYNWAEAQAQYQASLRLDPSCAECYHQYGRLIEMLGRNDEALVKVNQAIELDPINDGDRNQMAAIAFTARKYDLAITQFESLHEAADLVLLTVAYLEMKRFPEALATAKKCKGSDLCPIHLALVYGFWGRKREATKIINQFMEASRHRYVYPTVLARAYIATDDREQALKWLERAYEEKDPGLFWLKVGPIYDPLRTEPRFQALLQKLKFPE